MIDELEIRIAYTENQLKLRQQELRKVEDSIKVIDGEQRTDWFQCFEILITGKSQGDIENGINNRRQTVGKNNKIDRICTW